MAGQWPYAWSPSIHALPVALTTEVQHMSHQAGVSPRLVAQMTVAWHMLAHWTGATALMTLWTTAGADSGPSFAVMPDHQQRHHAAFL